MHESMFLEEIFWLFEIIHQYVRLARPKKKKKCNESTLHFAEGTW